MNLIVQIFWVQVKINCVSITSEIDSDCLNYSKLIIKLI